MKKYILLVILGLVGFISGCTGTSNGSNLIDDLGNQLESIDSYYSTASMVVNHHNETRTYDLEIFFKESDNYKVNLTNLDTDNAQIIVKNDEGVFVLTPSLNKSFEFDTEWPENGSHAYLLQSVIKDALNNETTVEEVENKIVITSNVDNDAFGEDLKQVSTINSETKAPEEVILYDQENKEVIRVHFNSFEYNKDISDEEFDVEKSMEDTRDDGYEEPVNRTITFPTYFPVGATISDQAIEDERGIIVFQLGDAGFTVMQEFVDDSETVSTKTVTGNIVVLKGSVAVISDSSIVWYENGIEYSVFSNNISKQELVKIANSFIQNSEK